MLGGKREVLHNRGRRQPGSGCDPIKAWASAEPPQWREAMAYPLSIAHLPVGDCWTSGLPKQGTTKWVAYFLTILEAKSPKQVSRPHSLWKMSQGDPPWLSWVLRAPHFPWLVAAPLPSPHGPFSTSLPFLIRTLTLLLWAGRQGFLSLHQQTQCDRVKKSKALFLKRTPDSDKLKISLLPFVYCLPTGPHKIPPFSSVHISGDRFPGKVIHQDIKPRPRPQWLAR